MTGPIRPEQIAEAKRASIPEFVIDVVNGLIAEKYSGGSARVLQKEIVSELIELGEAAGADYTRSDIYKRGWLDFEPVYEAAGWEVVYDKPAYCDTYEASFTFTPRGKKSA